MQNLVRTKPYLPESLQQRVLSDVEQILKSGMLAQGPFCKKLEEGFEDIGYFPARVTNSGASALEILFRSYYHESPGDVTIICPTQTFPATINAVIRAGCTPRLVDIDPVFQSLTVEIIDREVKKIREIKPGEDIAVCIVHMAGYITSEIEDIVEYIENDGRIKLFEDFSHAVGSIFKTELAGSFGHGGAASLFATKVMTSGEGGVIVNAENVDMIEKLRNHGCTRNSGEIDGLDYGVTCHIASCNYRMPEMSAALGLAQLSMLNEIVQKRQSRALVYDTILNKIAPEILLPDMQNYAGTRLSHWQYIVNLGPINRTAKDVAAHLRREGVPTANAYWPGCHSNAIYAPYLSEYGFETAEIVMDTFLSLPFYTDISLDDITYVCSKLQKIL